MNVGVLSGGHRALTHVGRHNSLDESARRRLENRFRRNTLKHANASHIDVALAFNGAAIRLTVQDDGVGFAAETVRAGHGLNNLRSRAAELGGTAEINSTPDKGTLVTVEVPAREEQASANPRANS